MPLCRDWILPEQKWWHVRCESEWHTERHVVEGMEDREPRGEVVQTPDAQSQADLIKAVAFVPADERCLADHKDTPTSHHFSFVHPIVIPAAIRHYIQPHFVRERPTGDQLDKVESYQIRFHPRSAIRKPLKGGMIAQSHLVIFVRCL